MAGKHRTKIGSKLSIFKGAVKQALKPEPKYPYAPGNLEVEPAPDFIGDIKALGFKDYRTLLAFLSAAAAGTVDDNELLLENLIQLLAKLPADRERKQLTDALLTKLWNGLKHPPPISVGEAFRYRSADGSGNNINHLQLGAANTPYARTTPPMTIQNPNQPDPAAIFDALIARGDNFEPHPQGFSSMFFYLATIIIHDLFQTSSSDYNINLTSSYADLSPLYGRNEDEQMAMRQLKGGLLKPDCFSSKRILEFPPGCAVFLIMFNRFHNHVVTQLARINENGRFNKPNSTLTGEALDAARKKYDDDLFQTGRLITCGLYGNVILNDYVKTILALNRTNSDWNLDPRSNGGKDIFSHPAPQGVGNQIAVEFNLIYRWHSTISQKDEKWTSEKFKSLLGGKEPSKATMRDVLEALGQFERDLPADPVKRRFGDLIRDASGTYNDDELVKILQESIEDAAGSFGANRVPNILKTVEVLGIMQARYWNVATLNEFRSFIGLTKHTTFEDINPDPVVAKKLSDFYDSPDAVELYPGLVAEKPKPPMSPGSGLCVNYTTSRAILSDAVTLIRGDRFYTLDYTPKNVTNWGFNEVSSDPTISQGHVLHTLVFRAFPSHFRQNSVYAHFPFVIPSENKKIHDLLGISSKYSWDKPSRLLSAPPTTIRSYAGAKSILSNPESFRVIWGDAITHATASPAGGEYSKSYCLSGDAAENSLSWAQIKSALCSPGTNNWKEELSKLCKSKTGELLSKYESVLLMSSSGGGIVHEVDAVRDIFSVATTNIMSSLFALPLKTETTNHPRGRYTEQEMFHLLVILFSSVFFDGADVAKSFGLREKAEELAKELGEAMVLSYKNAGKKAHGRGKGDDEMLPNFGIKLVERFVQLAGGDVEKAVWGSMLMTLAAAVANQTQLLAHCLDYYLGDGREYLDTLKRLAREDTKEADEVLMRYMLEGCRLRGTVALPRVVMADQTITDYIPCKIDPMDPTSLKPIPVQNPQPQVINLKAGSKVIVDLTTASHDPAAFPNPEQVKLDWPLESYTHYGWGPDRCLGMEMSRVIMTAIIKVVVGLEGLERVEGSRGQLKSFPALPVWEGQAGREQRDQDAWSGLRVYMTPDQKGYWPIPSTMRVRYRD
ncbi:heme peroxidase [Cladorrhinum sp. PSN332]|nr:heme peroxidase [Cladorrhinum sp. PSN332]